MTPNNSSDRRSDAPGLRAAAASDAAVRLPALSVIIPTRNRAADLLRAVDSLFRQTLSPDELIVVDQSPNEAGRSLVMALHAAAVAEGRTRSSLHYVLDAAIAGAGPARNHALALARGDILVILDDDVVLEPSFLAELQCAYLDHPELNGVAGMITNYRRPDLAGRIVRRIFWRGPFHDERQPLYWNAEQLRKSGPIPVAKFGSGGMSLRRSVLQGVRFDENLKGVPPGEDVDLCCRLGKNARLAIAPRVRYQHLRSSANRSGEHWLKAEAESAYYLYCRNWRSGWKNRLCFAWLNCGYALIAAAGSLRRGSLEPWWALGEGIRQARGHLRPQP